MALLKKDFKNIVGEGENAGKQNFLRSTQCFPPFPRQKSSFNPFPHNDTFRCPWETSLLKTLWEKEELLITSKEGFRKCYEKRRNAKKDNTFSLSTIFFLPIQIQHHTLGSIEICSFSNTIKRLNNPGKDFSFWNIVMRFFLFETLWK